MTQFEQHTADAEQGTAIGWISIAELFLVVGVILLTSMVLYHTQLRTALAKYSTLKADDDQLRKDRDAKSDEMSKLGALVVELKKELAPLIESDLKNRVLTQQAAQLKDSVKNLEHELGRVQQDLARITANLDQSRKIAMVAEARMKQLETDAVAVGKQLGKAMEEAKAARDRTEKLMAEVKTAQERADKYWAEAKTERDRGNKHLAEAQKREGEVKQLKADAEELKTALAQSRKAWTASEEKTTDLVKKLKTYENRFEGLRLDGKRVVFLVDRSGSMELVDSKTADPNKWPTVCETVRRIMRSLPELKEYQVITVADDVKYPLGSAEKWLTFDPNQTPDQVFNTLLKRVKPEGGTNLYSGLEAAFTYQTKGLDAIYFFSDGLPNAGPGLTEQNKQDIAVAKERGDFQRADSILGERCGAHVRMTARKKWNMGKDKVRIEAVGFFYESPELGSFLWALSRENGGNFVGMSKP